MSEMMQTNKQDIMNKIKSGSWTFIKVSSWTVWLLVKILFWLHFVLFFQAHLFICLMMCFDFFNHPADVKLVVVQQVLLTLGLIISLVARRKVFVYIFAWLFLVFYFYTFSLPSFELLYSAFDVLD